MNIFEKLLKKQRDMSEKSNDKHDSTMRDSSVENENIDLPSVRETTKEQSNLLQLRKAVLTAEDRLLEEALLECRRIFASQEPSDSDLTEFGTALYKTSPRICGAVGYELAKMNYSRGTSGFHCGGNNKMLGILPLPFSFFSWAGFEKWGGISFQVKRDCFQSVTPHLYFEADSVPYCLEDDVPRENASDKIARAIMEYSYGIENVKVTIMEGHCEHHCRLEFDLSSQDRPWGVLRLQDTHLHFSFLQDPVIQIPIVGEFFCTFGEVTPDGDIPLHRDDFCMK